MIVPTVHEYAGFRYEMSGTGPTLTATPLSGQAPAANKDKHRRAAVESFLRYCLSYIPVAEEKSMEVDSKGATGNLVTLLGSKLGRRVIVNRSEQTFKKPGAYKVTKVTKYSLYIEGASPEIYFNMTVNEVKARLAMLIDLIYSGVLVPIGADGSPRPVSGARPTIAPDDEDALGDTSPPAADPSERY